jgi:hypothetical protein
MKLLKFCCAVLALGCLVSALIPTSIAPQHTATAPAWVGRAVSTADFLLLGIVLYGVETRKPIYWRLIPILLAIFLLSVLIPTLWSLIRLSLPWLPFVCIIVFIFVGVLFFIAWWRNQKSYLHNARYNSKIEHATALIGWPQDRLGAPRLRQHEQCTCF